MDLQYTYQVQTTSHTIALLLSPALLHMYVHRNTMPPLPASAMDEGLAEASWVSILSFPQTGVHAAPFKGSRAQNAVTDRALLLSVCPTWHAGPVQTTCSVSAMPLTVGNPCAVNLQLLQEESSPASFFFCCTVIVLNEPQVMQSLQKIKPQLHSSQH